MCGYTLTDRYKHIKVTAAASAAASAATAAASGRGTDGG